MAKSNDKQNRTRGVTPCKGTVIPDPITSSNNPLGSLNNKDSKTIAKENSQNKLF